MYIPLTDDKHQMVRDSSKNALASADVKVTELLRYRMSLLYFICNHLIDCSGGATRQATSILRTSFRDDINPYITCLKSYSSTEHETEIFVSRFIHGKMDIINYCSRIWITQFIRLFPKRNILRDKRK